MDKHILEQYIDACELIKEIEAEIKRLKSVRTKIEQDKVFGSNPEFPYEPRSFKIAGLSFEVVSNPTSLAHEEQLLEQQKQTAYELKLKVEEWMPSVPSRMQRIIRFRCFQRMSWEDVCKKVHGQSGESIRKEFERFMNESR